MITVSIFKPYKGNHKPHSTYYPRIEALMTQCIAMSHALWVGVTRQYFHRIIMIRGRGAVEDSALSARCLSSCIDHYGHGQVNRYYLYVTFLLFQICIACV